MFDKLRKISGEDPDHIHFVYHIAKPLFESWGYKVVILHSDRDYLDVFNHIMERPRKHMEHKGMKYGFSISKRCSVKRDCKLRPINQYFKNIKEPYIQYLGICIDEPTRLASMHKNPNSISLLEKYGYTEEMAKELCRQYNLLSPCYGASNKRQGCWFCPNSKLCEHRKIRERQPEVWQQFLAMEKEPNLANDKWNVFGKTLEEHEKILALEEEKKRIWNNYIVVD